MEANNAQDFLKSFQNYAQNVQGLGDQISRVSGSRTADVVNAIFQKELLESDEAREKAQAIASFASAAGFIPQGINDFKKAVTNLKTKLGRGAQAQGEETEVGETASDGTNVGTSASDAATGAADDAGDAVDVTARNIMTPQEFMQQKIAKSITMTRNDARLASSDAAASSSDAGAASSVTPTTDVTTAAPETAEIGGDLAGDIAGGIGRTVGSVSRAAGEAAGSVGRVAGGIAENIGNAAEQAGASLSRGIARAAQGLRIGNGRSADSVAQEQTAVADTDPEASAVSAFDDTAQAGGIAPVETEVGTVSAPTGAASGAPPAADVELTTFRSSGTAAAEGAADSGVAAGDSGAATGSALAQGATTSAADAGAAAGEGATEGLAGLAAGEGAAEAAGTGFAALAASTALDFAGPLGILAGIITAGIELGSVMNQKTPKPPKPVTDPISQSAFGRVTQQIAPSVNTASTIQGGISAF